MPRTQRLSQPKLQRYHRALSGLLTAISDSRTRFHRLTAVDARPFEEVSAYVKRLKGTAAESDFTAFEAPLKRMLVTLQQCTRRRNPPVGNAVSLATSLPAVYAEDLERHDRAVAQLLRTLADVEIRPKDLFPETLA